MADLSTTLSAVPWTPGRSVSAYPRRSDLRLPDGPPPGIPLVATEIVAGDQSLTFTLPPGDYWAIAPLTEGQRDFYYVMFALDGTALPSNGSLLFSQSEAALGTSFAWIAPDASKLIRASVQLAEAMVGVGVVPTIEVHVNGDSAATLGVAAGSTQATMALNIALAQGDGVAIERLTTSGAACQVQIDRGA